jgi:tetratricopeptide (TPR) repeat protein
MSATLIVRKSCSSLDSLRMTINPHAPAETLDQAVQNAQRAIAQRQFAEAEASLRGAIAEAQGDSQSELELRDAQYTLAVAQRYQERVSDAQSTLDDLLSNAPEFGRAYQERGHMHLAENKLEEARVAYERAVFYNGALVASWKALLNLYDLHDHSLNPRRAKQQAFAKAQLEYLLALPPELVSVNSYLHEGKLYKADQLCRHFLREHKEHIEGMRLLARVGEQLGILADAEFLLETAFEIAPNNMRVRYDYANLLLRMQKFEKSFEQTSALVAAAPDDLSNLALHANATAGVGDQAKAVELYQRVLKEADAQPTLHVMCGHAQKTLGDLAESVRSYQTAYRLQPDYGDAYWSLANTKSYRFTDVEVAQMKEQEAGASIQESDRIHLCFALGKAFEDAGAFEESFTYYERGNDLKRKSIRHTPEYLAMRTSAQIRYCTSELFEERQGVGYPDPAPIFIVGLPRAGSTLLEQILASHSQVEGTMELPNIISLVQRLRGGVRLRRGEEEPRYPRILHELEDDYFARFGEQFIADTRVYRSGTPLFIDKNPNNFFHTGLIKLILPNAKVIDARRHPLSCCFSGFKQLFGQGQEFTYGLSQIGNYYREYVDLMNHWDRVLPGFVLRVQHEDVVDDLEGQVRRMLDFCDLPFEQSCIDFHKTKRNVRTPSSEQVRQPIFRTALDAWQNFEPWLDPLKKALGDNVREQFNIR